MMMAGTSEPAEMLAMMLSRASLWAPSMFWRFSDSITSSMSTSSTSSVTASFRRLRLNAPIFSMMPSHTDEFCFVFATRSPALREIMSSVFIVPRNDFIANRQRRNTERPEKLKLEDWYWI